MDERAVLQVNLRQSAPIPLAARFDCGAGELVALVGPSGSGKTTILRCVAGLNRPDEGDVRCAGEVWLDTANGINLAPQLRSVGIVFQSYALFPHLSALGNVESAMAHVAAGEREGRARDLLELVHLSGLEERLPRQLSGGQQQRVALARALARDPAVLLLDEPFSAVDRVTRRRLQRELAQLRARIRMPIVLVTHDLDEARVLADRMVILSHGETLQDGPTMQVMARPATAQVARLLDQNNLFEGRVLAQHRDEGKTLLSWLDYTLDAAYAPAFDVGDPVAWMIPPECVILHRRDRPSAGERENPVSGMIREYVPMGESTSIALDVGAPSGVPLAMSIVTHHARRNNLAVGDQVSVTLLTSGIHLMPPADDVAGGRPAERPTRRA
ncbi:MAG: ABC transporter ATP-binding protein [Burkholderiales bacterium]|nr:ABC transporter ATP-binding protein [Burkholderiales bacterium]